MKLFRHGKKIARGVNMPTTDREYILEGAIAFVSHAITQGIQAGDPMDYDAVQLLDGLTAMLADAQGVKIVEVERGN